MPAAIQPDPSLIEVGNLYADVQSRAIWLGVDPAVDPNESILLSDIVALMEADATTLTEAKAYTDAGVATRAPVVHTHIASQITDFTPAVTSVVLGIPGFNWVAGMIMLWSGSLAEIGVGDLAGWALCDGGNGTPDLRDRFIIGAGNKLPNTANTLGSFLTDLQGSHAHTIVGTAITEAQMPYHAHYGEIHSRQYGATYGGAGAHAHACRMYAGDGGRFDGFGGNGANSFVGHLNTEVGGAHEHSCYVDIHVGMSTDGRGSSQAHTHGCQSAGSHQHTVTSQQLRDNIPYFALAYIMKL